ncbi:MAG: hypothetical protein C4320_03505 [Armatimonadota bacterium]
MRDAGVDLIFEEATFAGERLVRVGDRELHGEIIVIDVGTRAAIPPIEGLKETGFLDNRGILDVAELPKRLLILGGGPIAVEFAQMFRRFGSEVVLVERSSRLRKKTKTLRGAFRRSSLEKGWKSCAGTRWRGWRRVRHWCSRMDGAFRVRTSWSQRAGCRTRRRLISRRAGSRWMIMGISPWTNGLKPVPTGFTRSATPKEVPRLPTSATTITGSLPPTCSAAAVRRRKTA